MPYSVLRFVDTPNPNAVKCVLDRPVEGPIRSYRSRAEAPETAVDELGAALLSVSGVLGVLISRDWITVNKEPEHGWTQIQAAIRAVLAATP